MPYVRRQKKTAFKKRTVKPKTTYRPKKRTYRKRPINNAGLGQVTVANQRPTIQRGYLPFGRSYFAKLPYVENFAISADGTTGLAGIENTFRTCSVYDPRYQINGHQPLQFDILASHYERVWVHGCKVQLTFTNPTADGMYCGYRVRGQTNTLATAGLSLEHIQEVRDAFIRPINNTGNQTATFSFYVSNHKLFGITKGQFSDLTYSHVVNDNPVVTGFIEPFAIYTVAQQTGVIRCNVKIIYYVQFTNPISENTN